MFFWRKKQKKQKQYRVIYPIVDIVEFLGLTQEQYNSLIETGKVPPKEPELRIEISPHRRSSKGKATKKCASNSTESYRRLPGKADHIRW